MTRGRTKKKNHPSFSHSTAKKRERTEQQRSINWCNWWMMWLMLYVFDLIWYPPMCWRKMHRMCVHLYLFSIKPLLTQRGCSSQFILYLFFFASLHHPWVWFSISGIEDEIDCVYLCTDNSLFIMNNLQELCFFFFFIFLSQFHSSVIHSFCRWSICLIWSCLMIKVHANVLCVLHDTYKFWLFPKAAIKFMAERVRERKEI